MRMIERTAPDVMTGPGATVETGEQVTTAAPRPSDDDLREEIERRVRPMLSGRHVALRVLVEDGDVLLLGRVERRSGLARIDEVVGSIPGVVRVRNRIGYHWKDGPGRHERNPRRVRSTSRVPVDRFLRGLRA